MEREVGLSQGGGKERAYRTRCHRPVSVPLTRRWPITLWAAVGEVRPFRTVMEKIRDFIMI